MRASLENCCEEHRKIDKEKEGQEEGEVSRELAVAARLKIFAQMGECRDPGRRLEIEGPSKGREEKTFRGNLWLWRGRTAFEKSLPLVSCSGGVQFQQ
jgi:hypothetical protein